MSLFCIIVSTDIIKTELNLNGLHKNTQKARPAGVPTEVDV